MIQNSFAFIKALLFISQVVYNTRGRVVLNIQSLALCARYCIIQYNTAARVVDDALLEQRNLSYETKTKNNL